ncbi:hypothetical protein, partial [Nostoc sp.]|uniref:hypothetical protein n=1 Tax=Nostoc sp. TaxID=1180 RepID=UPI002FF8406D
VHPSLIRVHPPLTLVHPSLIRVHPPLTLVHPSLIRVHPPLTLVHPPLIRVHPPLIRVHPPQNLKASNALYNSWRGWRLGRSYAAGFTAYLGFATSTPAPSSERKSVS